eukprot:CAMPEP_0197064344 /NCGR_PEP_ID=MMETSP1384-20130603/158541_1 /TAXON_ID=29189 /ORGANISM="Ammonia sp." /LENGTH=91 /DNA_ID=CAMNT_0042500821 /DNA_START=1 /DNA_END=273 /DNA_ORIENTATION=-
MIVIGTCGSFTFLCIRPMDVTKLAPSNLDRLASISANDAAVTAKDIEMAGDAAKPQQQQQEMEDVAMETKAGQISKCQQFRNEMKEIVLLW